MVWELYNAKCPPESCAVWKPWMCLGIHRAAELRMCVQSCFRALNSQDIRTLEGGSWWKESLDFSMVLEEFRSVEVQERLAIIVSHGPSFLPSSSSSLPRRYSIEDGCPKWPCMYIKSFMSPSFSHVVLPGGTNSFLSVPQLLLHLPLPAHAPCSRPQVFSYGFAFLASLLLGPKLLYPPSCSLSFQPPLIFIVVFPHLFLR